MQYFKLEKITGLLVGLVMFIGGTSTALAVGTASNISISNTATVDYTVGSNARSDNDTIAFLVDNRVDLTVVNQDAGNNVNVAPGSNDQVLEFLVTNTGNTTQGYLLTAPAPTTNIPMGTVRIYIDNGNDSWDGTVTETLYVAGTNAFDLNPNGTVGVDDEITVYIVANTPAAAVDTNQDDYRLVATTTASGGVGAAAVALGAAGAPTAGVDVVFADGQGTTSEIAAPNGDHSDAATYTVQSANLAMDKTIESTVDEFATGFSIPGAVVNYELTVTNSGATPADSNSVSVTDPIPANTSLCIATAGSCTTPAFTDGATTSNLTGVAFEYSIVAGGAACDNASFVGYAVTDADTDGIDDNNGTTPITCIRQQPTGSMAGSGGTFDIDFYVVIN